MGRPLQFVPGRPRRRAALPGGELHGPAIPREFIVQTCENRSMPRYRRTYLDQVTNWADPPFLTATAIETGMHTHRSIAVARLSLVVLELHDSYEPHQVIPYRTVEDGRAAAERLMAVPDSRGALREWRIGG